MIIPPSCPPDATKCVLLVSRSFVREHHITLSRPCHVSSPLHVTRSMGISGSARRHLLHATAYGTHPAATLSACRFALSDREHKPPFATRILNPRNSKPRVMCTIQVFSRCHPDDQEFTSPEPRHVTPQLASGRSRSGGPYLGRRRRDEFSLQ
jgi:hypothetical protein